VLCRHEHGGQSATDGSGRSRAGADDTGLRQNVRDDIRSLLENELLPPGYVITYAQFLAHYSGVRPELLQQAVAGAVADGVLERSGDALWATTCGGAGSRWHPSSL
jgi:hypothetical protein